MYCKSHRDNGTPAIDMKKLAKENISVLRLNKVKHNTEVDLHEDQICIIKGLPFDFTLSGLNLKINL